MHMSNVVFTSLILGAISVIPYNRYILWSLGLASFVLHIVDQERPANKLELLEASIEAVGETLKLAKASCTINYAELADITHEFLEMKLSVSDIKFRLLEPHSISTLKDLKDYVCTFQVDWKSIYRCEKKAKQIRTSIERILESEHRRELSEGIQTSREIISSLTRRASGANRRIGSATGSYEFILILRRRGNAPNTKRPKMLQEQASLIDSAKPPGQIFPNPVKKPGVKSFIVSTVEWGWRHAGRACRETQREPQYSDERQKLRVIDAAGPEYDDQQWSI
ncbi:hypothetical protein C8R45DRAFT_1179199 [Mycena sanguinolenta]|nr:hypothetical protein C8R45DRAFT_1179199 [Mycena sanguinolenta]